MNCLIHCAAIIIHHRALLLIRQPGSSYFVLPGGQPAAGEDHPDCLRRELQHTLRCRIQTLRPFGLFFSRDNQGSRITEYHLYQVGLNDRPPETTRGIADMTWGNYRHPPCDIQVSPVCRDNVMPLLYQQELID